MKKLIVIVILAFSMNTQAFDLDAFTKSAPKVPKVEKPADVALTANQALYFGSEWIVSGTGDMNKDASCDYIDPFSYVWESLDRIVPDHLNGEKVRMSMGINAYFNDPLLNATINFYNKMRVEGMSKDAVCSLALKNMFKAALAIQ